MHWERSIRGIREKKLEIARLDPRRGMPVAPPAGATLRAIAQVERKLGRELPGDYAAFLTEHDGYPDLLNGTSLLSAHHLARGTYDGLARAVIELGESAAALIPFGVDEKGETIFAWDTARTRSDGEIEIVVWANDIGARVADFASFLDFVDDVLESDLVSLRCERLPRATPRALAAHDAGRSSRERELDLGRSGRRGRLDSSPGWA